MNKLRKMDKLTIKGLELVIVCVEFDAVLVAYRMGSEVKSVWISRAGLEKAVVSHKVFNV
jgi:hypothetical protein